MFVSTKTSKLLMTLSVVGVLTACGGGSGDSAPPTANDGSQVEQGDGVVTGQDGADGNDNTNGQEAETNGGDNGQEPATGIDEASVVAPDGTVIRMLGSGDVTAQEGSTVTLSFTLENIDNEAVQTLNMGWIRRDENEFNTSVKQEKIDSQTFSVTLPIVDADSALTYEAYVSFKLRVFGASNEFGLPNLISSTDEILKLTFVITVTNDLPSEGHVILAPGRPAPGIADATMDSIDLYDYSSEGHIVIAGAYRNEDDTQGHAIWSGTRENLQLMLKTGQAIAGLPGNATFNKVTEIDIASNGEFAATVQLQGAGTSRAIIISDNGVVSSILRIGDPFPGSILPGQVTTFGFIKRTLNGTILSASASTPDVGGLWHWSNDGYSLVALTYKTMFDIIPAVETQSSTLASQGLPISADGCLISLTGNIAANDNGDVAFTSNVGAIMKLNQTTLQNEVIPSDCSRGINIQTRLAQYQRGLVREVVGSGDYLYPNFGVLMSYPGIAAGGFNIDGIRSIFDDGSVLFNAEVLEKVDSVFGLPARASVVLKTTPTGSGPVSLIAQAGETLPPDYINRFDALNRFYTSPTAGDQLAVMISGNDGISVLAGTGHAGQPHSTLNSVGASALRYVSGEGAPAPQDYPSSAFFSEFSLPVVDESGVVRFQANLSDSADDSFSLTGLWIGSPDGTTTLRTNTIAAVQSLGRQILLTNTDIQTNSITPVSSITQSITQNLANDRQGGLVFLGDLDDTLYRSNKNALVYIPADRSTVR